MKRTLYQCANAKVLGAEIRCVHRYLGPGKTGNLSLKRLIRGEELAIGVCQDCSDFDDMGRTPDKKARGWTPNQYERDLVCPPKRNHNKMELTVDNHRGMV